MSKRNIPKGVKFIQPTNEDQESIDNLMSLIREAVIHKLNNR